MAAPNDICGRCGCNGTPEEPLFYPCNCRWNLAYMHQRCFESWIMLDPTKYCDICDRPLTPIHSSEMSPTHSPEMSPTHSPEMSPTHSPEMPPKQMTRDVICKHITFAVKETKRFLHYFYVALAWFVFLPIAIHRFDQSIFNLSFDAVTRLNLNSIYDIYYEIAYGFGVIYYSFTSVALYYGIGIIIASLNYVYKFVINNTSETFQFSDLVQIIDNFSAVLNPIIFFKWDQFFGYDGSLIFLRNVFLVLCVNGVLTLMLVTVPYHYGLTLFSTATLQDEIDYKSTEMLEIKRGYFLFGVCTLIIGRYVDDFEFEYFKRACVFWCKNMKVVILLFVKKILLPIMFGWCLDLCSLSLFNKSIQNRQEEMDSLSYLAHWMAGEEFTSNCNFLKSVFLKLHRPSVQRQLFTFSQTYMSSYGCWQILTAIGYVAAGFLVIRIPIDIIKFVWPSLLPYNDLPVDHSGSSVSIEILLLHVAMPTSIIINSTVWLETAVRVWFVVVTDLLGIQLFLLGRVNSVPMPFPFGYFAAFIRNTFGCDELQDHLRFCPRTRPTYFKTRLGALFILGVLSVIMFNVIVITIPMWMSYLFVLFWKTFFTPTIHLPSIMDMNTVMIILLLMRYLTETISNFMMSLQRGEYTAIVDRSIFLLEKSFKIIVVLVGFFGIISLLFGLLQLIIIIIPFEVPMHKTPLVSILYALKVGNIQSVLFYAIIVFGPDSSLKRLLRQCLLDIVQQQFHFRIIMYNIVLPIAVFLSLTLAVPYVFTSLIELLIEKNTITRLWVSRILYPNLIILMFSCLSSNIIFDVYKDFKEKINKNTRSTKNSPIITVEYE